MTQRIYAALHRADRPVRPQIVLGQYVDDGVRLELCRALWRELHEQDAATPEWFDLWLAKVPSFGCNCRNDAKRYISANPVDYANFSQWACDFHNAVNARLGKKQWPYLT